MFKPDVRRQVKLTFLLTILIGHGRHVDIVTVWVKMAHGRRGRGWGRRGGRNIWKNN